MAAAKTHFTISRVLQSLMRVLVWGGCCFSFGGKCITLHFVHKVKISVSTLYFFKSVTQIPVTYVCPSSQWPDRDGGRC